MLVLRNLKSDGVYEIKKQLDVIQKEYFRILNGETTLKGFIRDFYREGPVEQSKAAIPKIHIPAKSLNSIHRGLERHEDRDPGISKRIRGATSG